MTSREPGIPRGAGGCAGSELTSESRLSKSECGIGSATFYFYFYFTRLRGIDRGSGYVQDIGNARVRAPENIVLDRGIVDVEVKKRIPKMEQEIG